MFCDVALSPCPNDTYLFHAWIAGLTNGEIKPKPIYADIETLNEWAMEGRFPLTKLSFGCYQYLLDHYQLLPIGSALGRGFGPKLIAKTSFPLEEMGTKKVAIPGKMTTAHLLFDRLIGRFQSKLFCSYDEVTSLIANDIVDCGVIIHETRFTFAQAGLVEIADLGVLWESTHKALLPLGGLAIKRSLPESQKKMIVENLKNSLNYAKTHPNASSSFILGLSQEKERSVIDQHIKLYVNQETEELSLEGIDAIGKLLHCPNPNKWLYQYP